MGLIVIYAIGPMRANVMNSAYGTSYSENHFYSPPLITVAVAMVAAIVAFMMPYKIVRKFSKNGFGFRTIVVRGVSWAGCNGERVGEV